MFNVHHSKTGKNCSNEHFCRRGQRVISDNSECVERVCQAPDCATCTSFKVFFILCPASSFALRWFYIQFQHCFNMEEFYFFNQTDGKSSCIWTRHFKRTSEVRCSAKTYEHFLFQLLMPCFSSIFNYKENKLN